MSDIERLLPRLAPPGGGEARLRAALQQEPRARHALRWAGGAALAASLALGIAWLPRATQPERDVERALRDVLAPPSPDPVIEGGVVRELPSADPAVRIFLVRAG